MWFADTSLAVFLVCFVSLVVATPNTTSATQPVIVLDKAKVIGKANGTVTQFLGIPYAKPPIGSLRLHRPEAIDGYSGVINATVSGPICLQQGLNTTIVLPPSVPDTVLPYLETTIVLFDGMRQNEDCLNLNVIAPANATPDSHLPVAVWIYGGGFQTGSAGEWPGEVLVARSIEIGRPIVFVAMNYRLSILGFLGGREVKEAGIANLGLHDQREALRWVQKYITGFGGDPSKVMIFGESAGSISVAHHMLANGGDNDGLFRAAFMLSGNALPVGEVDNSYLQETFDSVIRDAGCQGQTDPIGCLRSASLENITFAMNSAPSLFGAAQLNVPWLPRVDGDFVKQVPTRQLIGGAVAKVPFITGNDQDEGTIFSFGSLNVTTDDDFLDYLHNNYIRNASRGALREVLRLYPSDPAAGSPFGTGDAFAYTPQYKRMSAFQGDFVLQAPRRLFVQQLSGRQPAWAYQNRAPMINGIGAPHFVELFGVFGDSLLGDYLIRFADTLDPNGDGAVNWPQYSNAKPSLLTFNGTTEDSLYIELDTYRMTDMAYLTVLGLVDPI